MDPLGGTRRLGDYELIEEIAQGGMGSVFRARQVSLNRQVAVKVLIGGQFAREEVVKRFQREAAAAASLRHPGVVSIYDVGEHEGQPYFAMELIEGRDLDRLTREGPTPARRAATLLKLIAEAVQYAHEQGVLHRDLKPSNVLVDALDMPHITDFGLARRLEGEADLTLTGQVIGTPSYMPPEQAEPRRGRVTSASDVYSLGAIFYHLLTGRPPFMAETLTQTLRLVQESAPAAPRLLNPLLPRDLETICLKCLEKDPRRRYGSARELGEELGRYLRGEPILARPLGGLGRLGRWCRRKPALALSLGAGAALLLVVAIGLPVALVRINNERKRAETARNHEAALRARAEAAERQTQQQLYTALLAQARATVRSGELGQRVRALEAVRRATAISNSAALRGAAIAALALPDLRFERELPVPPKATLVSLDPAFEFLAVCQGRGPVEIRSVVGGQTLVTLPASAARPAYRGLWSPDGRFLAIGRNADPSGRVQDIEVWEVAGAKQVRLLPGRLRGAVSFHPWLPRILVAEAPATAVIWDLETGQEIMRAKLAGEPLALKFAPDGEAFAASQTVDRKSLVGIYNSANGLALASHVFTNRVGDLNWDPTGHWVAIPERTGAVFLMDAETAETQVLGRHKAAAVVAEFSPDGGYLFSGGWDRELLCWDVKARRCAFSIGLDSYRVQFCRDGRRCAILRWPEVRLQIHSFERPALRRELGGDLGGGNNYAAFSADGRWLAASGAKRLVLWDLRNQGPGTVVDEAWNTRVAFAPNGELFASHPGECWRWRPRPGANDTAPPELERLKLANPADSFSLCLLSNGAMFTGPHGSRFARYDQLTEDGGKWAHTLNGLNGVSSDERWLGVFGSYTPLLEVYRLPDLAPVARLTNQAAISTFAFSPRGDEIAVSSRAGVEFWDTTTWQPTRCLTNFTHLGYSRDGRTFWLTAGMRRGGLYDARTVEPLVPLPPGSLPLALSPDGRHLAVSVDARRMQVWDLVELRSRLKELGLDWADEPSAESAAAQ